MVRPIDSDTCSSATRACRPPTRTPVIRSTPSCGPRRQRQHPHRHGERRESLPAQARPRHAVAARGRHAEGHPARPALPLRAAPGDPRRRTARARHRPARHRAGIDTATMEGRAMFGMLYVLAELQRELIVANTNDGLGLRAGPRPGRRAPAEAHSGPGRARPAALRRPREDRPADRRPLRRAAVDGVRAPRQNQDRPPPAEEDRGHEALTAALRLVSELGPGTDTAGLSP
jgi:hypothetical protein